MSYLDDAKKRLTDGIDALKNVVLDAQRAKIEAETLDGVVELVALRAFSLLETYLEELFYLCMLLQHGAACIAPVLPVSSRAEVELLIYSDGRRRESFLTWLPYDASLDRADAYLVRGEPYSWLRNRPVEVAALKELTVVRNAVAHPSAHAATFLSDLAKDKGYQVTRPADYLKSLRTGSWEVLLMLTQVSVIATALAETSELGADAILQPEASFQAGQKAPAGTFACTHCGEEKTIEVRAKLGTCPSCGVTERCAECGHTKASSTTWARRLV
ncbi:zinc ribbon-containing protein [Nocardioides panaciterrulae]|uniref:Putative RNA-binding Zn-ribbon protein involved in translation (DUF1610 family) n=1 Tax=Nocardioides panaciterrulae TaxID=661492 RepID=A0A7Y9JCG0_9ACTN|nr:hypothetical protein [Nocardioides panaciterrulae]NYD42219.1 putative RNA-binding Zn-ribbon protein involved in translation (DUF1610 family) [Nocardioides panaciterrulae]